MDEEELFRSDSERKIYSHSAQMEPHEGHDWRSLPELTPLASASKSHSSQIVNPGGGPQPPPLSYMHEPTLVVRSKIVLALGSRPHLAAGLS